MKLTQNNDTKGIRMDTIKNKRCDMKQLKEKNETISGIIFLGCNLPVDITIAHGYKSFFRPAKNK